MGNTAITGKSWPDRMFDFIVYFVVLFVVVITIYPFLNVLAISLNDSVDSVRGGITIYPREFTWDNYLKIFTFSGLITGFKISAFRTVLGTLFGLISASMLAFTISRPDFAGRRFVSTFLAMTMYISGGIIPIYMLIKDLHMMNSFAVYVLPGLVSAFNVFVIRSFIDGLPYALQESAKLDGASDFTIYWRIILPLMKPALATISLFLAVGQWNAWFDTYLYNGSSPALTTLQYELMKVLQTTTSGNGGDYRSNIAALSSNQVSPESRQIGIGRTQL